VTKELEKEVIELNKRICELEKMLSEVMSILRDVGRTTQKGGFMVLNSFYQKVKIIFFTGNFTSIFWGSNPFPCTFLP